MGSRHANRCEGCERAHAQVKGAKCAMHESSTSPSIDRRGGIESRFPPPGWSGPVLYRLAGGRNPAILRRLEQERLEALKRNATPAQHRAVAAAMRGELNESIALDSDNERIPA